MAKVGRPREYEESKNKRTIQLSVSPELRDWIDKEVKGNIFCKSRQAFIMGVLEMYQQSVFYEEKDD